MARYEYDDFRVTITPRPGGESYDVRATAADGMEHTGTFVVPLTASELERTVLGLANTNRMSRRAERDIATATSSSSREVGGGGPPQMNAQRIGGALAESLLGGEIGRFYDAAVAHAAAEGRGVRLSLSLAAAPELLNLPWEFLYRRPRILASQRNSPLVRHLDTGTMAPPPSIESTVRMLGVIASPVDLNPLDVAAERQRVEQAVAKVAALGRIELDWLEPATPRSLRQALRDDSYHILHYVGHSDFTPAGEGLLFLEGAQDRRATTLDSTALANLLSDQSRLRLVVLNSCDGARTTLVDPFAGVATTLIQLGVPAVVAMQFEITDAAAIVFADELYTNLIGRQEPIDAAMAEARKAIYIEVDKVEWATPVLFVRDPEVELFRFEVSAAPLPPRHPGEPDDGVEGAHDEERADESAAVPPPSRRRQRWPIVVAAACALVLAVVGGALLISQRDDAETETTEPPGPPVDPDEPRPHNDDAAVQIRGVDGESRLYIPRSDDSAEPVEPAPDPETSDIEPAWDRNTNRLAFTRVGPDGSSIWYAVPGNGDDDPVGKAPAELIPPVEGEAHHLPAWGRDGGALFFFASEDCGGTGTEAMGGGAHRAGAVAQECFEELRRARFFEDTDPAAFGSAYPSRDVLRLVGQDVVVTEDFVNVRSIAPDPLESKRVAVVDATGLHLATIDEGSVTLEADPDLQAAIFVIASEQAQILAVTQGDDAASTVLRLFHRDGGELDTASLAELDADGEISSTMERSTEGITFVSMTAADDDTNVLVTVDERNDERPPVLLTISVSENLITLNGVESIPSRRFGQLEALVV